MNRMLGRIISVALAVSLLAACGGPIASTTTDAQDAGGAGSSAASSIQTGATTAAPATAGSSTASTAVAAANTAAEIEPDDTAWDDGDATRIELDGDAVTVTGAGAVATGSQVTITSAGSYVVTGKLKDGQIVVDTADEDAVKLVLDGVDITHADGAAIDIADAETVAIILADGSMNHLADGASYTFPTADEDEPNAALFSGADLTIGGSGMLAVEARYNDGIASKDGLAILGGAVSVDAVDDGIRGKDYVVVRGGTLTITAGGDGLKADNEEDATLGYVSVDDGVFDIDAGGDAIAAQTDVLIRGGSFTLTTGGGSGARIDETPSAKAIKAGVDLVLDGGTFVIDAADDAIHSNANAAINGGDFTLATGDDGVHADENLAIGGGTLDITECYEGIESAVITIDGGNLPIAAVDDGINVAGDNDGMEMGMGRRGRPGQDVFGAASGQSLTINGGYIYVDADGDGLDVNGAINMTNGTVIVNGPTEQMNGALDHVGFTISGGFLVAVGSAGMAQAPDESSTQYSLVHTFDFAQAAGTPVHIEDQDGEVLLTYVPAKAYQSVVVSSPEIANGSTYVVYSGGSPGGTNADGLYAGGTYTPGAQVASYTVTSVVTGLGSWPGGMPGGPGGMRPPGRP